VGTFWRQALSYEQALHGARERLATGADRALSNSCRRCSSSAASSRLEAGLRAILSAPARPSHLLLRPGPASLLRSKRCEVLLTTLERRHFLARGTLKVHAEPQDRYKQAG